MLNEFGRFADSSKTYLHQDMVLGPVNFLLSQGSSKKWVKCVFVNLSFLIPIHEEINS